VQANGAGRMEMQVGGPEVAENGAMKSNVIILNF
jgi:hypothetical protein